MFAGDEFYSDDITSGLDYHALKANARPSLERPPVGTCCPRCSEPLELEGYCGACDWREGQVETW